MLIHDRIYGQFSVNEPVLLELLSSPSLIRLKKITQPGIPERYFHLKPYYRHEHSVGVMLLLRQLGATLDEQIAGLIHDVSHLAFSHVADWAFNEGDQPEEGLQDKLLERWVYDGDLHAILTKYGYPVISILDKTRFTLLERPIPDICADRFDYALREFIQYDSNPDATAQSLKEITVAEGEMVFNTHLAASVFGVGFLDLQMRHWGGYEAVARYHLFGKMLRLCITRGYLNRDDFLNDEEYVLNIVDTINDSDIRNILHIMEVKTLTNNDWKDGSKIIKKFRYVDPKVKTPEGIKRLSEIDETFKILLEQARKRNEVGYIF